MASSCPALLCDTCEDSTTNTVSALCQQCRELYCQKCLAAHKSFKATKEHLVIEFGAQSTGETNCDACNDKVPTRTIALCIDCRELYCDSCKMRHLKFKATKNHNIRTIFEYVTESKTESATDGSEKQVIESAVVPEDSVNLSSDFEAFTLTPNSEILGAQAPVLSSSDRNDKQQQRDQNLSKHLDRSDMDKISVKVLTTFNGKIKGDQEDCDYRGIVCLKDGRVLLLDFDNEKLKMFDQNIQIICSETTKGAGTAMTKVSDCEIAVVCRRTVSFYSVQADRFVLKDKVFKLDGDGDGISYNENVYAIACNVIGKKKEPFITLCSSTGEEINRVTSFNYKPDIYINLDSEDNRLYVSPKSGGKFMCLSHQGHLQWEMDFYGADVVQLYNCLFVTCLADHSLYLCTKDGTYRTTLIQDDEHLKNVNYIGYHADTQKLFVTHHFSTRPNNITVLQLSF